MPPLTLTLLASVLQMHGTGATITSDNKGIEDLLAPIRSQLQKPAAPATFYCGWCETKRLAATHHKSAYVSSYTKGAYTRSYVRAERM